MRLDARRTVQSPPERQLVVFSVGNVVYGLPIERVHEVVNPQTIVELPHPPPAVLGVFDHRGEVVPVIDLRARFGLGPITDYDARRKVRWILVEAGDPSLRGPDDAPGRLIAVVVDIVHHVVMTRDPLRPPPPLGGGDDTRGIAGVLSRAGQSGETGLIFVLELEVLRALTEPVRRASLPPGGQ